MSRARAYLPLYVGDYLADTMHLTAEEHGAYLLLLMHYWASGQPLPKNKKILRKICGIENPQKSSDYVKVKSLFDTVLKYFQEKDGKLHHKRMDRELSKLSDSKEKFPLGTEVAKAKPYQLKEEHTSASGDAPPPEVCNKPTKRARRTARFSEWWSIYPNQKNRKGAEQKWKARGLDDKADTLIADTEARTKSDRSWLEGFVPMGTTYINQDRWTDPIEKAAPRESTAAPAWEQVSSLPNHRLPEFCRLHGLREEPPAGQSYDQWRGSISQALKQKGATQ